MRVEVNVGRSEASISRAGREAVSRRRCKHVFSINGAGSKLR